MKSIFAILVLTILFDTVEAQVDSSHNDSIYTYTRDKKSKKLNGRSRDKIISMNLPGKWDWHGGVWQFEPNGTMKFFYLDTIRTWGTWKVKYGIFYTETTWPVKQSAWRNVVMYSTRDTLAFKRPNSIYPDKIFTMKRIKEEL